MHARNDGLLPHDCDLTRLTDTSSLLSEIDSHLLMW